jgi:periplasmic divalent cation tolerance protein
MHYELCIVLRGLPSMAESKYAVTVTICGEAETAKLIAETLIEMRLAACVKMFPVASVYFWKGEIRNDNEIALFIKSKTELFDKIMSEIKEIHPYELPEIIQIPIITGLPEYFSWIEENTE